MGLIAAGGIGSGMIGSGAIASGHLASGFATVLAGTLSLTTEEVISGVCAVNVSQSGLLRVAMASVSGRMPAIGIVSDNVASGVVANIQRVGTVQFTSGMADFSGWLGKTVWVGRSGQVVQWSGSWNSGGLNTASGGDFIQRLGVAVNSGSVIFTVDQTMIQTQLLGVTALTDVADRQFGV